MTGISRGYGPGLDTKGYRCPKRYTVHFEIHGKIFSLFTGGSQGDMMGLLMGERRFPRISLDFFRHSVNPLKWFEFFDGLPDGSPMIRCFQLFGKTLEIVLDFFWFTSDFPGDKMSLVLVITLLDF